jgi:PAS domain S-box-containing protein
MEIDERLSSLLDNVPGAVYRGLSDWSIQFFGAEIESMTGYSPGEFLGRTMDWRKVIHPEDLPAVKDRFRKAVAAKEKVVRVKYRILRRDGAGRWLEDRRQMMYDAAGRLSHVDGLLLDITEEKAAEENLRNTVSLLNATLESTEDGILVVDTSGKIAIFNRKFQEMWRIPEEIVASRDDDRAISFVLGQLEFPERFLDKVRELYASPREESFDVLEFKDGRIFERYSLPMRSEGAILGRVWSFRDATERKRAEEDLRKSGDMLRQSQKMEAVGRLAGGVAHDFNNLLTVIGGYSDLLAHRLPPDSPYREGVEEIRKAATRASSLTRQLLAFSRKQVIAPSVANLNEVVAGIESMLRRLIGEDIDLITVLRPGLWNVRIDTGQFEQVLLNLAVNARDAMPGVGNLLIETENERIDERMAARPGFGAPGEYVVLSVRDTGSGMDEETLPFIFEPFFTTKEKGKGTGLGLAMVYGIVKQSDGYITAESRPGKGSTFRVYLPRCGERSDSDLAATSPSVVGGGRETVLLVEDDEMVRNYMSATLSSGGYTLLTAADGLEAIALLEGLDRPVDLIVSDVIMPKMGGKELNDWLATNRPEAKVLFISGYVDDEPFREQRFERGEAYLQKPFTPEALLRTVRKMFDPKHVKHRR